MKSDHLLIVGCGDIGTRVGLGWHTRGGRVTAVRRNTRHLPEQFEGLSADYTQPETLAPLAGLEPDFVLFSPLPAGRDVAGYQRGFADAVSALAQTGVLGAASGGVMISSTRVYTEVNGGAVNEDAPVHSLLVPSRETDRSSADTTAQTINGADKVGAQDSVNEQAVDRAALAIVDAEQRFLSALAGGAVLRASGLYGLELGSENPGMLLSRVLAGTGSADPTRISNRVHREDLASAVLHLLDLDRAQDRHRIYNCSDNAPTPIGDVEAWIAARAGISLTQSGGIAPGRGNRRVVNDRLRATGFEFTYPDFRAGYSAILERLGYPH